jgi:hypothetical protein
VHEVVTAAMAHTREERIPSAGDLADRIEAALVALGAAATHALPEPSSLGAGAAPASSRRPSTAQTSSALATNAGIRARRASPWLAIAAAAGVVALGGVGIWLKLSYRPAAATGAAPSQATSVGAPAPPVAGPPVVSAAAPTATASESAAAPAQAAPSASASAAPASHFRPLPGKGGTTKKGAAKDPVLGF